MEYMENDKQHPREQTGEHKVTYVCAHGTGKIERDLDCPECYGPQSAPKVETTLPARVQMSIREMPAEITALRAELITATQRGDTWKLTAEAAEKDRTALRAERERIAAVAGEWKRAAEIRKARAEAAEADAKKQHDRWVILSGRLIDAEAERDLAIERMVREASAKRSAEALLALQQPVIDAAWGMRAGDTGPSSFYDTLDALREAEES